MRYEQPSKYAFHFATQLNVHEYFSPPPPARRLIFPFFRVRCPDAFPTTAPREHLTNPPQSPTGDISPTIYELRYDREIARMAE